MEGQRPEVLAIQKEQIENAIDQLAFTPPVLTEQPFKPGLPLFVQRDDFTV